MPEHYDENKKKNKKKMKWDEKKFEPKKKMVGRMQRGMGEYIKGSIGRKDLDEDVEYRE